MVKSIVELRNELCESLDRVKRDRSYLPMAQEIANTAGKIINSLRVQVEYHKQRREKCPVIAFLVSK